MEQKTGLRKLQLTEINIYKEIVRICNENGLTYYISGGTFLGAVRHKEFIPWDDDMDIAMPRPDFKKFLEIAPRELKENYYLIHYSVCDTYIQHAQICDRYHKILMKNAIVNKKVDVWVDVFPLDGLPDDSIIKKIHKARLLYYRMMYVFSVFDIYVSLNKLNRPLHERMLIAFGRTGIPQKMLNSNKRIQKFDKVVSKYDFYKSKEVLNFSGRYKFKSVFDREKVYANGRMYEFEDMMLNGPYNYDFYLKQIYGDYMKLPPEGQRNTHETVIIEE